jgi:hypothetical protein
MIVYAEKVQQLLKAVEYRYLQFLEDPDFGFADVSPRDMLQHLRATYGQVTPDDMEQNRSLLSAEWNPDDPIEDIWLRLRDCQGYATAADEPITNSTAIRLTLAVFEKIGVFASAVDKWRDKPAAEQTLPVFKTHFNFENKERLRKLTAQTAGYHGAHLADVVPPPPSRAPDTALAATPPWPHPPVEIAPTILIGDMKMYYCWTHGLGKSASHTSAGCENPAEGHKTNATIKNMMGGNDRIYLSWATGHNSSLGPVARV